MSETEIDIDKVERLLWEDGYDYRFSAPSEDGDVHLEVFSDTGHVAVDGLYPDGSDNWIFMPETIYVSKNEPSPLDNYFAAEAVGLYDIETEHDLHAAIVSALGTEA